MTSNPPKRFQINRNSFTSHYEIKSSTGSHLYYVEESTYTPRKPDLTIHEGTSSSEPILAVSHLPKITGQFKIGLGDPSRPSTVQWENMQESFMSSDHRWSMTLPSTNTAAEGQVQRRKFVWKRTRSVGVSGLSALSNQNFKLLDEETAEVLAVFYEGWFVYEVWCFAD